MTIFGNATAICSIREIKTAYPDQWVAMSITEIDPDGFAAAGHVILHDSDERTVWSAAYLGDSDDLIYVFYTGPRRAA